MNQHHWNDWGSCLVSGELSHRGSNPMRCTRFENLGSERMGIKLRVSSYVQEEVRITSLPDSIQCLKRAVCIAESNPNQSDVVLFGLCRGSNHLSRLPNSARHCVRVAEPIRNGAIRGLTPFVLGIRPKLPSEGRYCIAGSLGDRFSSL